jgi:hypothetical protein
MAVVHSPDSEFAKEMRKWEAHHTQYGPPGRPYTYQPYPTRMYKAVRADDGSRTFEAFTANDEHEQRNLESRGFVVGGQQAALDALSAAELEHSKLAAERNWEVAHGRVSEKAAAEVAAHEAAAGARHLPSIPEAPKRRGRKPKAEQPAA